MIDIHAHILPGLDDGSETMEESLKMADLAVQSGVDTLVVTPHCNVNGIYDHYCNDSMIGCFQSFELAVKQRGLPLSVLPGMEVFASEEVPELLKQGKLITLNKSRYLLIEFDFYEEEDFIEELLTEIIKLNYYPIIAHPERYPLVQKYPEIVYHWRDMGCQIQMNKGSVLGGFGYRSRETALELLEHNLVSCIASDAHSPRHRTTDMSGIYHFICRYCGAEVAHILFNENPRRVVENRDLINLHSYLLF